MAKLILFLACLVSAIVTLTAQSNAEARLRSAILNPRTTKYVVTENIVLTGDLPAIPQNKVFSLSGQLNGGKGKVKIDGAGKYTMFRDVGFVGDLPNGPIKLQLQNLILTGAKAASPAVELRPGSNLTVSGVDFVKNPKALVLTTVNAVITNSNFTGHTERAITIRSDEDENDLVKISGCTFTSNKAKFSGGAVNVGKYANIDISSTKFIYNSANSGGGAIFMTESFAEIKSSEFTGNAAQQSGGAIQVYRSGANIYRSTFKNNVARTGAGGALEVSSMGGYGSIAWVSQSTFSGNSAPKSFGGAFVLDTNLGDQADITFCKTTFDKNTGTNKVESNGYIIGETNTIYTTTGAPIPSVTKAASAVLIYASNPKCK